MLHIKPGMFWRMTFINALIVAIVVWLAGVSVKDYACFLVNGTNQGGVFGAEFRETLQQFLLKASIAAFCIAAIVHYLLSRLAFRPIRRLASAARQMTQGDYPEPVAVTSRDDIGRLTADFNQLIATLRMNQDNQKQMLADMSHDLRTPLSNLTGYLEALKNGVIEGDKELYESLHEEALYLAALVGQFHELNVWQARPAEKDRDAETIRMATFWTVMRQAFELESRQAGVCINVEVEEACIQADAQGLKQVVENLVTNAIQYNAGSVVTVLGKKLGSSYLTEIANPGIPLAEDKLSRLFERFYRGDDARQRSGGSGLGLAIVKEIIARQGGECGVRYEQERYVFWYTLPLVGKKK